MRKFLIKIFNLLYMVGAGLSVWSFATKPIVNVKVEANFTGDQIADVISNSVGASAINIAEEQTVESILNVEAPAAVDQGKVLEPKEVNVRVKYTDETEEVIQPDKVELDTAHLGPATGTVYVAEFTETFETTIVTEGGAGVEGGSAIKKVDKSFSEVLTKDKIVDAFSDGLNVKVELKVEAKYAYDLNNKTVVTDLVKENVYSVIEYAIESVTKPLHNLIKSVAMEFAKDILKQEVQNQIATYFSGEGATIEDEKIEELFENIYSHVDGQEITVDDLANIIVGRDSDGNELEGVSVVSILNELNAKAAEEGSDVEAIGGITYDPSTITGDTIADQMTIALSSVPGLVEGTGEYELLTEKPSEAQVLEAIKSEDEPNYYYLIDGEYVRVTEYDPDATEYYKQKLKVKDVDAALAELITQLGNKTGGSTESGNESSEQQNSSEEESRAIKYRDGSSESSSSQDQLRDAVSAYIYKFLPIDKFTAKIANYEQYVPMALLALIILLALPWFFFFIQTLFRTFSREKYWTRGFAILFWTIGYLVFGIILTYGLKHFIPFFIDKVPEAGRQYVQMLSLDVRTSSLIPSFVFCAYVVMLIPYLIICASAKRRYKNEIRIRRQESRIRQQQMRRR